MKGAGRFFEKDPEGEIRRIFRIAVFRFDQSYFVLLPQKSSADFEKVATSAQLEMLKGELRGGLCCPGLSVKLIEHSVPKPVGSILQIPIYGSTTSSCWYVVNNSRNTDEEPL